MSYAETLTLDQLRVLDAIVAEGSFSGAARRLRRSQGAVSYQVAAIEEALELQLFDRTRRLPRLTEHGQTIVREASAVLAQTDYLRTVASRLRDGLESRVSLVVDVLFPVPCLAKALRAFRQTYPDIPVELRSSVRAAISRAVDRGDFDIGITGEPEALPNGVVVAQTLTHVELVPVVSCEHPLASVASRPIGAHELNQHVHVVLREEGADDALSIPSPGDAARVWRMSDHLTRMQLVDTGLGWSRVPRHAVAGALDSGRLVELDLTPLPSRVSVSLKVIHRRSQPIGPAARWLLQRLAEPVAPT